MSEQRGAESEARKETSGKPPMHLLPPFAMRLVAEGFGHGEEKYGAWNYLRGKGLSLTQLQSAAERHINSWARGEDVDAPSGCRHLAMAACCLLMALESEERGVGTDDRCRVHLFVDEPVRPTKESPKPTKLHWVHFVTSAGRVACLDNVDAPSTFLCLWASDFWRHSPYDRCPHCIEALNRVGPGEKKA